MCVAVLPPAKLFFLAKGRAHTCAEETAWNLSPHLNAGKVSTQLPSLFLFLFVSLMGRADLGKALSAATGSGGFSRRSHLLQGMSLPADESRGQHGALLCVLAVCFSCVFWLLPAHRSCDGVGHLVAEPQWRCAATG